MLRGGTALLAYADHRGGDGVCAGAAAGRGVDLILRRAVRLVSATGRLRWTGTARCWRTPTSSRPLRLSIGLALSGDLSRRWRSGCPRRSRLQRSRLPWRGRYPGALLLSPLVFPVLITGLALLQFYSALGHAGCGAEPVLRSIRWSRCPTSCGPRRRACSWVDPSLEEAARTLGARRVAGVPPGYGTADRARRVAAGRAVRVHGLARQLPDLDVAVGRTGGAAAGVAVQRTCRGCSTRRSRQWRA